MPHKQLPVRGRLIEDGADDWQQQRQWRRSRQAMIAGRARKQLTYIFADFTQAADRFLDEDTGIERNEIAARSPDDA